MIYNFLISTAVFIWLLLCLQQLNNPKTLHAKKLIERTDKSLSLVKNFHFGSSLAFGIQWYGKKIVGQQK